MARYYFNIRHEELREDEEGSVHGTQHEAWIEATETCGQMMRDLDGALAIGPEWRMEVTNEQREIVFVLKVIAERGPGYVPAN
jgi:hypothetical protein